MITAMEYPDPPWPDDGPPGEDWHEDDCEPFTDMDGSEVCGCPGQPCGSGFSIGPAHDPYGVQCELTAGEHEAQRRAGQPMQHLGTNPLPGPGDEPQYVVWRGGGYCAGDPLPTRNVRYLTAEESAALRSLASA